MESKDVLDRKYFSIKQLGLALAASAVFVATWTWRVAVTHYQFELLKETTEINAEAQAREDQLIRQIHMKDITNTNERLDKKTKRIEEQLPKE